MAAYLGAATQDDDEYASLYQAVAEKVGTPCKHIKMATLTSDDVAFIREHCCLILIGGGDTPSAWRAYLQHKIDSAISIAIDGGVPTVGVSAGAIQLGLAGFTDDEHRICNRAPLLPCCGPSGAAAQPPAGLTEVEAPYLALGRLPFVVGAHEEASGWKSLREGLAALRAVGTQCAGLGLPCAASALLSEPCMRGE